METKLRLLIRAPQSALLLKAVIFAALLVFLKATGFGLVASAVFLIGSLIIYYSGPARGFYGYTFLGFMIVSLATLSSGENVLPFTVRLIALGLIFYALLGIKSLIFVHRLHWHFAIVLALSYGLFLIFFSLGASPFFLSAGLVCLAVFFLVREFFMNMEFNLPKAQDSGPRRSSVNLYAAVIVFLVVETLWLIDHLPVGIVNAANLVLLAEALMIDLSRSNIEHTFNVRRVLIAVTLLVGFVILIFSTVRWSI